MFAKIDRAVVVEDDLITQKLIHLALQSLGVSDIVDVKNGAEAITALAATQADLVIMDWNMPVMDGLECTRKIRAGIDGIDKGIKIILLTANHGPDYETAAYAADASLYMEKPFSIKKLLHGIETMILKTNPTA